MEVFQVPNWVMVLLAFSLGIFGIICWYNANKRSKKSTLTVNDVIHLELLQTMPGICSDQFKMTDRSTTENVCDVTISGEHDKLIFCVKLQTSNAMGRHRVISVKSLDKNNMSYLLENNFKDKLVITDYKKDTFIKRLVRKVCGK